MPAVGPAPAPNPNRIKYEAENADVGNGATINSDTAASSGKSVQNLHLAGSSLRFNAIDGGTNGCRATIDIHYASTERGKLRMAVNGVDYSFINTFATGGWSAFTGDSKETVPLEAGTTNVIEFTGGNGGVNVDDIAVSPLPTP
ncbi:MAG TPA: carbohydrate-binding protein [Verrucomicrobiae bacterium]|nr:carbohydrate-binding protein [Verrucomicrobiae bacterium]